MDSKQIDYVYFKPQVTIGKRVMGYDQYVELINDIPFDRKLCVEEGKEIIGNGHRIDFNDWEGVGFIRVEEDLTYSIVLMVYGVKRIPVSHGNIEDCFDWMFDFCNYKGSN